MSQGFCTECSGVIETFEGLSSCPHCGTKGLPCSNDKQVTVSINTHELRLLCIWAENWQAKLDPPSTVVYAIARRLKKQLPEGTLLTMRDEFQALRDAGFEFTTNHPAAEAEKDQSEH